MHNFYMPEYTLQLLLNRPMNDAYLFSNTIVHKANDIVKKRYIQFLVEI